MTKKDFKLIANCIASYNFNNNCIANTVIRAQMAQCFAIELAKTNKNFNVDRFISACIYGVK